MPDSPSLPGNHAWRDASGRQLPIEFFKFFRDLLRYVQDTNGNTVDIASIIARLDALEKSGNATLQGLASVLVQGTLADGAVQFLLQGDEAAPAASSYYGTDDTGAKGFHALPDAPPQLFNRITNDGDARIDGDGNLRVTY